MTSRKATTTGWRRAAVGAVSSGALVVGMLASAPLTLADPASPITPGGSSGGGLANDAQAGDDALAQIAAEYDTGNGGGQISQLIHSVLLLRSQGFYPSKGNVIALQEGLDKRPNQVPLREALEQTLSFQRRNQQRGLAARSQSPTSFGVGQIPPGNGQPIQIPLAGG